MTLVFSRETAGELRGDAWLAGELREYGSVVGELWQDGRDGGW